MFFNTWLLGWTHCRKILVSKKVFFNNSCHCAGQCNVQGWWKMIRWRSDMTWKGRTCGSRGFLTQKFFKFLNQHSLPVLHQVGWEFPPLKKFVKLHCIMCQTFLFRRSQFIIHICLKEGLLACLTCHAGNMCGMTLLLLNHLRESRTWSSRLLVRVPELQFLSKLVAECSQRPAFDEYKRCPNFVERWKLSSVLICHTQQPFSNIEGHLVIHNPQSNGYVVGWCIRMSKL